MTAQKSAAKETLSSDRSWALGGLIAVAEGAIVSRVLASSGGGNVTLFAFDGGQGLSEHTAPFDALVQVIDGSLNVTIGGEEIAVQTGEVVLIGSARLSRGTDALEGDKITFWINEERVICEPGRLVIFPRSREALSLPGRGGL